MFVAEDQRRAAAEVIASAEVNGAG